jgi:hypothetical protein
MFEEAAKNDISDKPLPHYTTVGTIHHIDLQKYAASIAKYETNNNLPKNDVTPKK